MKRIIITVGLGLAVAITVFADTPVPVAPEECKGPKEGEKWVADLGDGVQIEFMPVAAGSFQMGSESGYPNELPVHSVTLSKPFWMGKTEVTQAQYQRVMGCNPACFNDPQNPVEQLNWNDAMEFCRKLTALERQAGHLPEGWEYTLPTEAQWEYACRAGTTGDYAGELKAMAWYDRTSKNKTQPAGTKQPNGWGLYDMHGNVCEWCSDWYGEYSAESVTDPSGATSGSFRVHRGGGWNNSVAGCRSSFRLVDSPEETSDIIGFRICLTRK
jgi:formylglycine-generating enzyme required for sulfatase activity